MPTLASQAGSSSISGDEVLSWTVHLARQCRLKLAASIALIAGLCWASYFAIGALGVPIIAVVMVLSLADFLFPVKFIITTDGAECRMLLKSSAIRWERVRFCYVDDFGVKLSPLSRSSRLEAFRGVYLRFNNNEEQVMQTVRSLREKLCLE